MNQYTREIRSRGNVSETEIAECSAIIYAYGAVKGTLEQIVRRVKKAEALCFVRHRNRMVATAALKRPAQSYRDKLKNEAHVELSEPEFPFEMGYVVVVEGHRGEILEDQQRLSDLVMADVISQLKGCNVFATTKIRGFKETALPKLGFQIVGQYQNGDDQTIYVLTKSA